MEESSKPVIVPRSIIREFKHSSVRYTEPEIKPLPESIMVLPTLCSTDMILPFPPIDLIVIPSGRASHCTGMTPFVNLNGCNTCHFSSLSSTRSFLLSIQLNENRSLVQHVITYPMH